MKRSGNRERNHPFRAVRLHGISGRPYFVSQSRRRVPFRFGPCSCQDPGPQDVPVATTVVSLLSNPGYGLLYILLFMVLALHIHHGIWSLLQTLGLSHPRYTHFISRMTTMVPLFFLIAASGIPLLLICGVKL